MKRVAEIRRSLALDQAPWNGLSDDFLAVAFTPRAKEVTVPGLPPAQVLEWLGDRTLDLIVASFLIVNYGVGDINSLVKHRDIITSNESLRCYMQEKTLCQFVKGDLSGKSCANSFETLVGLLYWYLTVYQIDGPIRHLEHWMNEVWNLDRIVTDYLQTNNAPCTAISSLAVPDLQTASAGRLIDYYRYLLADPASDASYNFAHDDKNWQTALMLAHRIKGLPITSVVQLYQTALSAASEALSTSGSNTKKLKLLSIFEPEANQIAANKTGFHQLLYQTIKDIQWSLSNPPTPDEVLQYTPISLQVLQYLDVFPELRGLKTDNPAVFVKSLLK